MPLHTVRPAVLLLSSTLLAIAADPVPLPHAVPVSGFSANSVYQSDSNNPIAFSTGDVDGDGYTDIALGGRIFWGSASGWSGADYFEPEDPSRAQQSDSLRGGADYPYETLWITPNITGGSVDGKAHASLIGVDAYGDGRILHVEGAQTPDRVLLTDVSNDWEFDLNGLVGEPTIADFSGDSVPDIAWVSDESVYSYVNLAIGSGGGEGGISTSTRQQIISSYTAAVTKLPDSLTGRDDLLVIRSTGNDSIAELYANGISTLGGSESPVLTQDLGNQVYYPILTTGDVTADGQADVAITSIYSGRTGFLIPSLDAEEDPQLVEASAIGWIVPDATGDGIDDVTWGYDISGLISGRTSFVEEGTVDRTVPYDPEEEVFEYFLGWSQYQHSFRLVSVSTTVSNTPFARRLIAVDISGFDGSYADSLVLPSLLAIGISGEQSASVGGSVPLSINGGSGPYAVTATGGVVRVGGTVGDSLKAFVTPTRSGTIHVTVTDANGLTGTFDITATELDRTDLPAPSLAVSTGSATVFGPVCPGTTSGLANLRRALGGRDSRRARGFAWDAASQSYTELPSEPDGGLTPLDGVFLASRVDLGLDFSGPALPVGATILLRAEWNFVGMGPIDDDGTIYTSHSLSDDFDLTDLDGASSSFSHITAAYRWDGSQYVQTDVIESGIGYWIRNVTTDPLLLTRHSSFLGSLRVAKTFARDAGAPPAPPSTDTKDKDEGGSCGSGSGIGVMLVGLLAFLRLRSRRS